MWKKNPQPILNAETLDIVHLRKAPKCELKQLDIVSLNVILDFENIKHEILSNCLIVNLEKNTAKKFHLESIINDFSTMKEH